MELCINRYGYGSIPINTIFSGMNIHLPAILMFTRCQGFDPSPYEQIHQLLEMTGTLASKLRCTSLASLDEFHWHFLALPLALQYIRATKTISNRPTCIYVYYPVLMETRPKGSFMDLVYVYECLASIEVMSMVLEHGIAM